MSPSITVTSPPQHDILTYPLAVIRGHTSSPAPFIHVSASDPAHRSTAYPIRAHAFTALYLLKPGRNTILLSATPDLARPAAHTLVYQPAPAAPPCVHLVYLLASDSDGAFQSPDADPRARALASGVARLRTAGYLIQAATAEMLHAHNLQRRTFRLAAPVHVHRLPLTTAAARAMPDMDLWSSIARDLSAAPRRDDTIDVAVMSFSRMTPAGVKAHTALGGGPLALFGGASLFTWPASVDEVPKRMLDFRTFDARALFDDSAGRMPALGRRACCATTIGALLHELGHCLSLPHPCGDAARDGGGIMARGFDWLDRLFVQSDAQRPFWDRGSAVRLRHHRFLQFEGEAEMRRMRWLSVSPAPTPTPAPGDGGAPWFERGADGAVVCRSAVGIGHVGYYCNGDNAAHEEFGDDEEPTVFCLPGVTELRRRCKAKTGDKIVISAIDVEGRIAETPYEEV